MKKKLCLGNKRKREKIKPIFFPEKLFNILKNINDESLIHWDKDGKSIVIEKKFELLKKILKKDFNQKDYNSFVRQLNLYGFEKDIDIEKSDKEIFTHKDFKKDANIEVIKNIKRKKIKNKKNKNISENESNINSKKIIIEKLEENNDEDMNKFFDEIKKEKDDNIIIEKYKSKINDNNFNINAMFLKKILEYIKQKTNELNKNINEKENQIKNLNIRLIKKEINLETNDIKMDLRRSFHITKSKKNEEFKMPYPVEQSNLKKSVCENKSKTEISKIKNIKFNDDSLEEIGISYMED